ncbi:hypothetical protein IID24_01845 [Patescibacteria group bacterium]|nr:hypothetical protein [Patescibacteria group bacterium]
MAQKYSRPLSLEAKAGLINFLEALFETLIIEEVDEKDQIAKDKAIEALQTDLDITLFMAAFLTVAGFGLTMFHPKISSGEMTTREAAERLVGMIVVGRAVDISERPP